MVLRLLENAFASQKLNLFVFTHSPKEYSPPGSCHHLRSRRESPISPRHCFLKDYFPPAKKGKTTRDLKKCPKLNLWGYWSHVLINPTISARFTFFFLFWHNLDSTLPYPTFNHFSPTICQIKIFNCTFFPILKSSPLLSKVDARQY